MTGKTNNTMIVILGPTSSGKSELAVFLAEKLSGEVVSADSRQIYKGLDIGSGKITKEEMRGIPHHLLDVANPKKRFSIVEYQKLATTKISEIFQRGKTPILCGGTGFYIQSIVDGIIIPEVPPNTSLRKELSSKSAEELFSILQKLAPQRASEIDAKNPVRLLRAIEIAKATGEIQPLQKNNPPYNIIQIGLTVEKEDLKKNIMERFEKRIKAGMVEEATQLHKDGLTWKRMRELGLEYRTLADFLTNKITKEEMRETITKESLDYAKRQMTWFKRDKRIAWFTPTQKDEIFAHISKLM